MQSQVEHVVIHTNLMHMLRCLFFIEAWLGVGDSIPARHKERLSRRPSPLTACLLFFPRSEPDSASKAAPRAFCTVAGVAVFGPHQFQGPLAAFRASEASPRIFCTVTGGAGLDFTSLDDDIHFYSDRGVAESTCRTYKSGLHRLLSFCNAFGVVSPSPVIGSLLCYFVVYQV